MQARSCALDDEGYSEALGHRLGIVTALYATATELSLGDRYLVLDDGEAVRVLGELTELFLGRPGQSWVGVSRREIAQLVPGDAPELRLTGLVSETDGSDPCLLVRERTQIELLCAERGGAYRCWSVVTERSAEAEISGSAHPLSSQYSYDVAERCAPTLDAYGLQPDVRDRAEITRERTALAVRRDGSVMVRSATGVREDSLLELLDATACPNAF